MASPGTEAAAISALAAGARGRTGWRERFGLTPLGPALRDARKAIVGQPGSPPAEWGVSSLKIFKPRLSFAAWLGRTREDGLVPVYNFFNRTRRPKDAAYSVRVTDCRDFQGGRWTYDSHNGTDFAAPVGTPLVTAASGKVLRVACDLDRGGLKVCVDHGDGLFATYSHMARTCVREGELVRRGDPIGLSGASGVEIVLFFPWVAPHLHLNVWLGGEAVDPFAAAGETSLWRTANAPVPHEGGDDGLREFMPSEWDPDGVAASIEACRDPKVKAQCLRYEALERRAAEVLFHRVMNSAAFATFPPLYRRFAERAPRLDLPFRARDYRGAWLPPPGSE
ncbi:MAG: M23 family metallopeptidase [Deltaproteobacteria bacterium]|nr:M23 family metallopeptidase [Deltaproteobacteria bacterium]